MTTWESCGIADACLSVWVVFPCNPIIFCFKTYHRDLLEKVIYLFIFGNFRRTRGAPWKNRSGVPFVRDSPRTRLVSTAIRSYYTVISWFGAQIQRRQKTEAKTIKKQHSQKHRGLNVIPTHDCNCTAHCYNVKQSGRVREGQTGEIIIAYVCYLFWPEEASSSDYCLYPTLM